ncbi:MAG: UDP-3-O-acyl-N-acetylglucosamine deacetylase [Deltaproteobacteria bacterium]|nr:UDP-3-O-acyl-N-acetylglucosamine deacetylase [Deltaproteobacteria bacterium]
MRRRRVRAAGGLSGMGLHSGVAVRALVAPAPWGAGIAFEVGGALFPVGMDLAHAVPGASRVGPISTPEHLLAALVGLGITDARVTVEGLELPALGGGAAEWCDLLRAVEPGPAVAPWRVLRPYAHTAHGGEVRLEPAETLRVEVEVELPEARLSGSARWERGMDFCGEVAPARTFALERQVEALRAAGRGRGASLKNTAVLQADGGALNPGGLRWPDEPIRHKLLDAIGDIGLLGHPLVGEVWVRRGSHLLHLSALRAALAAGAIGVG